MAKNLLTHLNFAGSIELSIEDECLHGRVLFIEDLITYEGNSIPELRQAFEAAVQRYTDYCERTGRPANKPCSGTFNVRVGAELHRAAVLAATSAGIKLNEFVCSAIQSAVEQSSQRVVQHEHQHNHMHTVNVQVEMPGQRVTAVTAGEIPAEWQSSFTDGRQYGTA